MDRVSRRQRTHRALFALALSLLVHLPLGWWAWTTIPRPHSGSIVARHRSSDPSARPVRVRRIVADLQLPVPSAEPTPEPPSPEGQIVEIAPPERPERPDHAEFLAEYDSSTEHETVDPRFRVDRSVTAPTYSPEDRVELQVGHAGEAGAGGGTVADGERFRTGRFSLFPEREGRFTFEGVGREDRARRGGAEQSLGLGSPSNDHLPDIERGDRTSLNAHEFLYAAFWNRVKRLVSFYADQTLANARPTVPITKVRYSMVLGGLIARDGSLAAIDIVQASGVPEFDEAIREAFRLAAPFPDPPEGAAESDGFIHIREFGFVIEIGSAQARLDGIDPRSQVKFPGLETIPR